MAYLTPTLLAGGAERQMVMLASTLARQGFDARFIVLSELGPLADEAEAAGLRVDLLGLRRGPTRRFGPTFIQDAWRALQRYRRATADVDLVDAWLAPAMTFAVAAQPVARVPILVGGRRSLDDLYRTKPWYRRAAASFAARRMAAVVANSEAAALEVVSTDHVPASRVHVIPNAVEPPSGSSEARAAYRAAWGVQPDEVIVGAVANYKAEKGLDVLLEAAGRLAPEYGNVRFVLVGEGPERPALEAMIQRMGLDPVVRMHGAERDARSMYVAFDILVQASRTEGFPNVLLEAAAAGLPIVATAVGGTAELLSHERDALLVPPNDPAALAQAIGRMVTDSSLRTAMTGAAQVRATAFSLNRLAGSTAALYRSLANRTRR